MSTTVKIKRSAVQGKVPLDTDLELGELAINTYDGKLFMKKSVAGANTIIDVTAASSPNLDSVTTAGATQTQIAYFPVVSFRSIKLIIQAYDYVTGDVHVSELLVVHNGTTASATEYGVVYTGSNPIVVYDVDISAGNVRLLATASANPITYAIVKTMLTTAAISTESFSWDSNTESPGPA